MGPDPNIKALYGTRVLAAGITIAAFGAIYRADGIRSGATKKGMAGAADGSFYYDAPWFAQLVVGLVIYQYYLRSSD